jgi:hypothetical protein
MTSQHYQVMHVLVRSLISNSNFDIKNVPKKMFKFAAREYEDYVSTFKKEIDIDYENTKESQVISQIFEKINQYGYYKIPETLIEETLNASK